MYHALVAHRAAACASLRRRHYHLEIAGCRLAEARGQCAYRPMTSLELGRTKRPFSAQG